jgi:hypothetical protein
MSFPQAILCEGLARITNWILTYQILDFDLKELQTA